jgi:serine/threonine-protein kinase
MSPEQIDGQPVGKAADIFSLGVLLYYLYTGTLPFNAASQPKILRNILAGAYQPPDSVNPRVNALAVRIIDRCLRRDPAERYPEVSDLAADLEELNRGFGFTDPAREIRAYCTGRDQYLETYVQRLKTGLQYFARTELAAGRRARALGAVNHLLNLDRNDRETQKLYGKIRGQGRQRASMRVLAAATVLVVLALIGYFWGKDFIIQAGRGEDISLPTVHVPQPTDQPAPALEATPPAAASSPAKGRPFVLPVAKKTAQPAVPVSDTAPAAKATAITAPPAGPVPEPARFGTLKISTKPWAKVYVDGIYKGNTPFLAEVILPVGGHTVKLVNPYCAAIQDTVTLFPDSTAVRKYSLARQ